MARNTAKYEWEKGGGIQPSRFEWILSTIKFLWKTPGDLFLQGESNFFPISHAWRKTTNKILPRLRDLFRLDLRTKALSIAKLLNSLFNVFSINVVIHLREEANLHAFHFLIREIKVPFYFRKSLYLKGKNYFIFINVTDLQVTKLGCFFLHIEYCTVLTSSIVIFPSWSKSQFSYSPLEPSAFPNTAIQIGLFKENFVINFIIIIIIIIIIVIIITIISLSLPLSLSFYYHYYYHHHFIIIFLFLLSLLSSL